MEKEIDLGKEADLEISVAPEGVKLALVYQGKGAEAGAHISLKPEYFVEKLKAAIPGQIDDLVLDGLLKMLKQ